jgi:hypothetical protein
MRRMRCGGLCGLCGVERDDGAFWENYLKVLDFGAPMGLIEPDTSLPVLCDNCELLVRICLTYYKDLAFAQHVYCASSAEDALRLMKFRAHPELVEALKKMGR